MAVHLTTKGIVTGTTRGVAVAVGLAKDVGLDEGVMVDNKLSTVAVRVDLVLEQTAMAVHLITKGTVTGTTRKVANATRDVLELAHWHGFGLRNISTCKHKR